MGSLIISVILMAFGIYIVVDVKKNGVASPDTNRAKMLLKIMGEKGAKVFYSILGWILILGGGGGSLQYFLELFQGK